MSTEGLCEFTSKVTGSRVDDVSLHPPQRSTVRSNIPPECVEVMNLVIKIVNKIIANRLNH